MSQPILHFCHDSQVDNDSPVLTNEKSEIQKNRVSSYKINNKFSGSIIALLGPASMCCEVLSWAQ